jgi:putative transposase
MAIVTRTEQIQFKCETIGSLCHASKNLYNAANYLVRQRFFENDRLYKEKGEKGKHLWYKELYPLVKSTESYKALLAQTAQQILRLLDKSWKAYFKSFKAWLAHPEDFFGKPKPPKYKAKNGEHILVFTNQQCKIIDGILKFPKIVGLELKTRLSNVDLREVRIIPHGVNYICEIVYDKEIKPEQIRSGRIIGIDPGVSNVVTIANNFGEQPIIVKGGVAKSMNQFYNKEKSRVQSIYDKAGIKYGSKLRKLDWKRNNKLRNYFHKLSRMIVNYAIKHNVETIVIGKNDGWKQESDIGKTNNQNFVSIPHAKLIDMIRYKAEEVGIDVILQQESHTSRCSFLDLESVEHHDKYMGRRGKGGKKKGFFKTSTGGRIPSDRGIFRSALGKIINADVNGALNIIRKAVPKAFVDGIEGVGLHPRRYYV